MEEEGHGQNLRATLSQQSAALQKLQIKIAQLEKRNQAQGQRPQQGKTRCGDAPGAEAMEEKGHGQNLEATLSQQSVALQKLQIKIAQLEKRNQAQGQRPQQGKTSFGDVPGAGYQMRAIFLLRLQGPNQNMSSIKIHTTSGNRNLNKRLFKCQNLRKSEIITGNQGEYKAKGNQGEYKAKKEQEVLAATTDLRVNCSMFISFYKSLYFGIIYLSLPRCFDPRISQEEHKNRAELSQEDGHTNQGKWLQDRHPQNQICPKKNIILHHAKASKVSLTITHSVHETPASDIIQLVFVQNVENISGCKEESFKEIPPDNHLLIGGSTPKMVRTEPTRSMKDHTLKKSIAKVHSRGVILSYLLKEEPPDAQSIPKPKQYQGKTLESQESMKADLLYLGAGYPVSRSKLCQGVGYDAAIKSAAEPEVDPIPYSTSQGANQDICTLKIQYLTNQEDLNHADNFYGFFTQEGVQEN
ncbi:hypothetical protein DY000_02055335 [Brassica cretica]|uniref:Uncharacterized protein n=1 Tax=Brassica cretica TaxID=69181 RepID=A0ABQ7A4V2_BRACR|nr:hypothetical protein DY000_02055335 [Brassica cretica]